MRRSLEKYARILQHIPFMEKILTAVQRRFGEYWRSLDTRSTASGGNRLLNTWDIEGKRKKDSVSEK